ncbi:hypothetical protein [Deminuibacter soli]|uniref:Uncharacterized protein n=1 Tax=Deminuibacter soli TaxID=2291815 RepID=A0A3E1NJ13_9BACT|nr:hypothetical protein [Deminuibacter soli]RFM27871.1 hypothetical protein DXN05_14355 [Deminuibacter soli]
MAKSSNVSKDLTDTPRDLKEMEKESANVDLPEMDDIPGQENVEPAPLGELADTTFSSADEEGDELFDDTDDDDILNDDSDVTEEERDLLDRSANSDPAYEDETGIRNAALDSTDFEGEPLNEAGLNSSVSGEDLDVPGSEEDDEDEDIGEEDEENNNYSLNGENA